jgi:hypothetical protein
MVLGGVAVAVAVRLTVAVRVTVAVLDGVAVRVAVPGVRGGVAVAGASVAVGLPAGGSAPVIVYVSMTALARVTNWKVR